MQSNIFLIILSLLIIKPVVNAQFISVIGIDHLPIVFVLVAISAMLVSTLYSRSLNRRSLRKMTSITLLIFISLLFIIGILLRLNIGEKILLYILYISVAIFGVLSTSQFWIMANMAFDAREAKRLFSFIGAGAIAGGVAGGYIASILSLYFDSIHLLFISGALLAISIPLNNTIWQNHIQKLNSFRQTKRLDTFGEHPFWIIRKSRHLTYLALLVGLGVVVSKLVEFQFSSIASIAIPDADELTSFFGFWFSSFNVVSLLVQLFLTRKIVGIYGVGTSLFALPGGVLLGCIVLLFTPVLAVVIFTKLWEVSVKQSINKAATELLSLPIPSNIKSQTKSFIDVFVDMAATGIGGLILIVVINGLGLSVSAVAIFTIGVLLIWFWVAIKVRQEYINSFKSKLYQADKLATLPAPNFKNTSVLEGLKRSLDHGTQNQILYVLKKVREIADRRLYENVAQHLDHDSPEVRLESLKCIYYLGQSVELSRLQLLINDPEQEVRYKAFGQILRQTTENRIEIINSYLLHNDPKISGAALVGLSEELRNNPEMKKMLKIEQRIDEKLSYIGLSEDNEDQYHYKTMVLRAIGHANISGFYTIIDQYLLDKDIRVCKEAILSAGYTMNIHFVPTLAAMLINRDTRNQAESALINFGPEIINELKKIALDQQSNIDLVHRIPGVLEKIDSQKSITALLSFLDTNDVALRLEALRSLNTMQQTLKHLKIPKKDIIQFILDETNLYKDTLVVLHKQNQLIPNEGVPAIQLARVHLIELLERRLDGTLERIFRLLGLRYPPNDIIPVYESIKSVNIDTRVNAIEYLDNLLESNLKKALIPLAETAMLETITNDTIKSLKVKIPNEYSCFAHLLKGRDLRLKLAVFELIKQLKDKKHVPLLRPFEKSPNENLREKALEIIMVLNSD